MNLGSSLGLLVVALFAALIGGFALFARFARRSKLPPALRPIAAFAALPHIIGQAVETGRRLHLSLGSGQVGGPDTASILAGLTFVDQVTLAASVSDKPPVVTAGDGAAAILAQDALRRVYARQNMLERFDPNAGRLTGPTPVSFAAGAMMTVPDETVAANVFAGAFGTDMGLVAEAGARQGLAQMAGAGNPLAQALAFAATDQPLIGEELYAAGAYLGRTPTHIGSLRAQDVMRFLIVLTIAGLALVRMFGIPLP